jgi:hypothetical protein
MDKSMKKFAIIEIEFDSVNDLKFALSEIANEISCGKDYGRKKIAETFCQYQTTIRVEPDFRIEEINGQQCMVFQSKMNNHGK